MTHFDSYETNADDVPDAFCTAQVDASRLSVFLVMLSYVAMCLLLLLLQATLLNYFLLAAVFWTTIHSYNSTPPVT